MASLAHALWIGGPPASGKTTVARRLARRHGLRWYNADAHTWAHRDRALEGGNAAAHRWEAMTPDERWVDATPDEIETLTLVRERGPMILDDVRALPRSPLVVVEGSPLRPALVAREAPGASRSIWLVPTERVLRARLEGRGLRGDVSDPRRAQRNEIDRALSEARDIDQQARDLGLTVLVVGGSRDVDATVAAVETCFADALARGPRAVTAAERRALHRYANDVVVEQLRAYHARPWAPGAFDSATRPFLCECDDPDCDAVVVLRVAALPAEPVLAPRHVVRESAV